MSCKFSCFLSFTDSLKENDVGVFQSDNGDLYTVKYRSNVCRDLLLTIEWRVPKQILVTVKLYNTTFKRCFSSRGIVINGRKTFMKLRGAFNVSSAQNYKVLCVVNIIPYIKFNAYNETAFQSIDSGFTEPDFQLSSLEEHSVFYDKKKCRGENVVKHNDNINIERNDIVSSEFESPESVMETEHDFQSEEQDFELDKIPCKGGMNMEESHIITSKNLISPTNETEMSVTSVSKGNIISCHQNDKTIRNDNVCGALDSVEIFKSGEILDNNESTLKNSLIKHKEDLLISKSDIKTNEFNSSCDSPLKINESTESKKDTLINSNIPNEDFSKEILEKSTNFCDNLKLLDVEMKKGKRMDEERNLQMETDFSELSSENPSMPQDKENALDKKVNMEIQSDIPALIDNTNRLYIHNKSETEMHPSNVEDDIPLELCDVSEENNQISVNDLSSLPSNNIVTFTENHESLEINEKKQLLTAECESPPVNFQRIPVKTKGTEIKSRKSDCSKPVSPELPSSKTDFVFQTLVRKLSTDDSDLELNDDEEAESTAEISIKSSSESKLAKGKSLPVMESELKGLSLDMLDLLTTGDMADAVIANGEKNIKVHRAVISARSSVLKQMFTEQREEAIKYKAIVDIPSYILEDIIIFLYVGLVYIKNNKMAQDLHEVAKRYRINDLIDICSKHICK